MKIISPKNKLNFVFLVTITSLFGNQNQLTKKTLNLLKKSDIALTGWQQIEPTWLWSSQKSKAKIASHISELKQAQEELALLLTDQNQTDVNLEEAFCNNFLDKLEKHIELNLPPSSIRRYLAQHSFSAVGLLGGIYIISRHLPINSMIPTDTEKAAANFTANLDALIKDAQTIPEFKRILEKHAIDPTNLEKVSAKTKSAFLHEAFLSVPRKIKEIYYPSVATEMIWNHNRYIECLILYGEEKTVNLMAITAQIKQIVASICAVPLVYAGYKVFSAHAKTSFTPLKKLLIKLQLQFNQNRYTNTLSPVAQGMNIYWLSEIKNAENLVPAPERTLYGDYIKQLESNHLNFEQKITLIENMLRNLQFLQQA